MSQHDGYLYKNSNSELRSNSSRGSLGFKCLSVSIYSPTGKCLVKPLVTVSLVDAGKVSKQ